MPSSASPSPSPPSAADPASPTSAGEEDPLSGALTIAAPSPLSALPAASNPNPNSSGRRGLPPPCWTNEETLALIDSYRDKWYSLRRGNLRAAHWDEVAASVASRSSDLPGATPKTSVQCRHKIEKLRKRYRSERQRSLSHDPSAPPSSPWIFFKHMHLMENPNPNPNPSSGNHHHNPSPYRRYQESEDDDDDEEEEGDPEPKFLRRPPVFANGSGGGGGGLKFKIPKAVRTSRVMPMGNPNPSTNPNYGSGGFSSKSSLKPGVEEVRRRLEAKRRRDEAEEQQPVKGKDADAMGEMVRALRSLGDGYMRMEQVKMEMAREMERARMEMELKRTEMILDTQRRIVDSFIKGVAGEKKSKRSMADS